MKRKRSMDVDPVSWTMAEEEMREIAPADLFKREAPERLKGELCSISV